MWESLGLEDRAITTLAWTEWGLFAGTQFDGVFRWDEASREWTALGLDHAIVSSLVYVPGDTSRLLVGMRPSGEVTTEAAIYATADRGATWTPWDDGRAESHGGRYWAFSLASDPDSPDRLIWGSNGEILLSEDGGASWKVAWSSGGSGPELYAVAISPDAPELLWAGGMTGFFNAIVYRSRDGGQTWEESLPLETWENVANELAAIPGVPNRLIAAMHGGVMRSDDAGSTWTPALRDAGKVVGLVWRDGCLFATSTLGDSLGTLGLFRSCDGGVAWSVLTVPHSISGGSAIISDARGYVIIGTAESGVWRVGF